MTPVGNQYTGTSCVQTISYFTIVLCLNTIKHVVFRLTILKFQIWPRYKHITHIPFKRKSFTIGAALVGCLFCLMGGLY